MKQLLFLLLFPCLALAQYQGNANQKITLGEQTTADGLVFRGVASIDTVTATSKITRANKQDTSAYILLDTVTNLLWHYKTASNGWIQAGGSTLDTATMLLPYWRSGRFSGVLPVANGGTGAISFSPNNYLIRTNSSGVFDTAAIFEAGGNVGIGTISPTKNLDVFGSTGTLGITRTGQTGNNDRGFMYLSGSSSDGATIKDLVQFGSSYISSTLGSEVGQFKVNVINNGTIEPSLFVVNGNGNAGVGTGSPSEKLHVVGNARITAMNNINDIGANANGVLQAATSDMNLKNTIENSPFGLNEILLLNPVTFLYNDENRKMDSDVKEVGFIAQDVFDVIPNAVSSTGTGDLQLDYRAITATLVKAIQEQQALIKALEQRILILENK